jgi:CheY-like chemotaxis protein
MNVLLVEDEAIQREWSAYALEDAGYTVLQAAGANAALKILRSENLISVMFADFNIPGSMNGLELARTVNLNWPYVKVILSSGSALPGAASIPKQVRFLPKPYLLSRLTSMVEEATGGGRGEPSKSS